MDNIGKGPTSRRNSREARARQLALRMSIDIEVERAMKFLGKEGLTENTFGIFTADHGNSPAPTFLAERTGLGMDRCE